MGSLKFFLAIYLAAIGMMALILFGENGFTRGSVAWMLVFAAIFAIPLFDPLHRSYPPSRMQRIVVAALLWIRRIVGTIAAAFFLTLAVMIALNPYTEAGMFIAIAVLVALSVFSAWIGLYGWRR